MQISPSVLEDVRRIVAEALELDIDEVRSDSLFFTDLGAESIDLLDLRFRFEKHFSVRVEFAQLRSDDYKFDDQGRLTPESISLLKTKFPFLKLDGLESRPLDRRIDFLTIEAIAGFVQMALNGKEATVGQAAE